MNKNIKFTNKKVIEWLVVFSLISTILFIKHFKFGCLLICGDWYDE